MNIFERFADHQIGYLYQKTAEFVKAQAPNLVAALNAEAPKAVDAAAKIVVAELDKAGPVGVAIGLFINSSIASLDAAVLSAIGRETPPFDAFVAALVAKLEAHASMLLAA